MREVSISLCKEGSVKSVHSLNLLLFQNLFALVALEPGRLNGFQFDSPPQLVRQGLANG